MEVINPEIAPGELERLQAEMASLSLPELEREITRMPRKERAVAFRMLEKNMALTVFEEVDPFVQTELMEDLRDESVQHLFSQLDPDDRAALVSEMPAGLASHLLRGLSPHERAMTEGLLGYPDESAGRRMSPEVAWIPEDLTVGQALTHLHANGSRAETIYDLPVVGAGRKVVGLVSLRKLLRSDDEVRVGDLAREPITIRAEEDQEVAAKLIRDYRMLGLPVVDSENRLLGVISVDDAFDILLEEEDEDTAKGAGTEPLKRPYLLTSPIQLARSRIVWLVILILAASLTVTVLDHFEQTLAQVVTLSLFMPLLIGTGGNTGAQAVTTVVRAMSLDQVEFRDLWRVVGREMITGFLLGLGLGLLAFFPIAFIVDYHIGVVVSISLLAICTLATTAGSLVPMFAKRFGIDPAVVSAPMITTLVDATGLIIYFSVAIWVLGLAH